jgi:hypothetical protein
MYCVIRPNNVDTNHTPSMFLNKKLIIHHKKTKMPSMSLEITKKTCMIGQKCPKMYALFFSFSKGKDVFLLYSKKTKKNP